MHRRTTLYAHARPGSLLKFAMCLSALLAAVSLASNSSFAQSPVQAPASSAPAAHSAVPAKSHAPHSAKKKPAPVAVEEVPPPPPPPHWPINDSPNPPSVVWDSSGLRISATNSSLQQILNEVSTDTGTKVVGTVPDQRVYGIYGPGDAREVLTQLLQGSGYNILLAGDIGKGAPSEIVLTPRRSGPANAPNAINRNQQPEQEDEVSDQPEEEPPPPIQQPQMPAETRPGFGPNGPMRTPQQVMEEMQQRQLQQQQQMQQQQQAQPQQNPQQ